MEIGDDDDMLRAALQVRPNFSFLSFGVGRPASRADAFGPSFTIQKVEDELGMEWEVNADDPRGYDMVLMDDWESQIVFESYNPSVFLVLCLPAVREPFSRREVIHGPFRPPKKRQRPNELAPYNHEIESGDWVKGIIWDATRPPPPAYLGTVVEEKDDGRENSSTFLPRRGVEAFTDASSFPFLPFPAREVVQPVREQASTITRNAPTNLDPYNISNDHHYEGGKQRVRQTFGSIVVQHAWPALKLQLPFVRILFTSRHVLDVCDCQLTLLARLIYLFPCAQYKTSLTKQEARSWHRPALQFPANIKISFERVKPAKKMKDKVGRKLGKGGDIAEGLRKPGDLTLKDTSSFVLWEFSVSPLSYHRLLQ
jgi:hypothetical protein